MKKLLLLGVISLISGCTSIDVEPVRSDLVVSQICIEENPKVAVSDFIPVLEERIRHHNISPKLRQKGNTDDCEFVLRYTALKSWDMAPYLSHAELYLYKGEERVAKAVYHLIGKGGFSLTKWANTESKMNPVVDQLLNKNSN